MRLLYLVVFGYPTARRNQNLTNFRNLGPLKICEASMSYIKY
jgi:hypothetical protein